MTMGKMLRLAGFPFVFRNIPEMSICTLYVSRTGTVVTATGLKKRKQRTRVDWQSRCVTYQGFLREDCEEFTDEQI